MSILGQKGLNRVAEVNHAHAVALADL
jgi:glycine cleavage system pyridoxal-binding protein P